MLNLMGRQERLIKLKKREADRFQEILAKIAELSHVNDQGRMSWSDFRIDIYFSLAFEAFDISHDMSVREASTIVRRAIIDCRTGGELSTKSVERAIATKTREFFALPTQRYSIATDISVTLPVGINSKRFRYREVSFEVTKKYPRYMANGIEPHVSRTPFGKAPEKRYSLVISRCDGRSEFDATSKVFNAISVFVATANLAMKDFNILGGEQRPRAILAEGPYHYTFCQMKRLDSDWYNPDFRSEFWEAKAPQGTKFVNSSKRIRAALARLSKHPLREPLSKTILMMQEGMATHLLSQRTLHYWTAIERLFSSEGEIVSYEKIIERATFLEPDRKEARLFLKHLASLRNETVHQGKSFDHQHILLEHAAALVRRFVFYLIFNGEDFSGHGEFLETADLPSDRKALKRRQIAIERRINFIEKYRHK